MKSIRYGASDK